MEYSSSLPIDLHIHSTASDGSLSPANILTRAHDLNLGAISITDHDTVAGSREALQIGIPPGVHFLTGVEVSTAPPENMPSSGSLHILGYGIALGNPRLNLALKTLQDARLNRNPQIINRLNELGFSISLAEVQKLVGNGQLGRPHLAKMMRQKGYVDSIDEAFDRYLGHGKPAYVEKYRIPCHDAIEMILAAGGIPVLAHPYLMPRQSHQDLETLLLTLKEMGLKGLEVFYPQHPPEETAYYARLAEKLDLVKTGGTDFHGDINPEIQMGTGYGDFFVPFSIYSELVSRC